MSIASPSVSRPRQLPGWALILLLALPAQLYGRVEAASSQDAPRSLHLQSGTFALTAGVDPGLVSYARQRLQEGHDSLHLIAQRPDIPDPSLWQTWRLEGIHRASYLGDRTWVLRAELKEAGVEAQLQGVLQRFGATSLSKIRTKFKMAPSLLTPRHATDTASAKAVAELKVTVLFYPGTSEVRALELLREVVEAPTFEDQLGPRLWAVSVPLDRLRTLLRADEVQFVEEGPPPARPLMDQIRRHMGAEAVQGIDASVLPPTFQLSGEGVRLSNSEGLLPAHDDFWNHDAAGNRTTPRWLGCQNGGFHGGMTAGIMLGNGWQSAANGGTPFQFRGIAPEATFDCYHREPDASNHSFTQGNGSYNSSSALTDERIRGDAGTHFHPHVGAVANQGIRPQYGVEAGYYSVYRNAKNEITVGNIGATDFQWQGSSLGPTWDGRIKPDLVAPGGRALFPRDRRQIVFDLDYLRLRRGGAVLLAWNFGGGDPWRGGWGDDPWWGRQNVGVFEQWHEDGVTALRVPLHGPPWGTAFANRPRIGTLLTPDALSTLSIDGNAADVLELRYRLDPVPDWWDTRGEFNWASDPNDYQGHRAEPFPLIADGAWHTVSIPVGNHPDWAGDPAIDYLNIRFAGPLSRIPAGADAYGAASGSSAAAPVVTGTLALLLEQMVDRFGIVLGDHSPSPFHRDTPGHGVPLASTMRALVVHTARDMAYIPRLSEPDNPDTLAPTVYHPGPDLVTGYGALDIAEVVRLVDADADAQQGGNPRYIVEGHLDSGNFHQHTVQLPPDHRGPLKITLAWDDAPGDPSTASVVPKLVNDLDLLVEAPDDEVLRPWTIHQPYTPTDPALYPDAVEPEPITASDIRPARRDRRNDRDNLEQVLVDRPMTGTWRITVIPRGMAAPPQSYSLILGSPPVSTDHLQGGKVAFVSDRSGSQQIFVKEVDSPAPPQQWTNEHFGTRHPAWAPSGDYLAYVTQDILVGDAPPVDVVKIVDAAGQPVAAFYALSYGFEGSLYPQWSPDGSQLVVTAFNKWGERSLTLLEFDQPYDFRNVTPRTLVPEGVAPEALDGTDAVFSPDGAYVYFHADTDFFTGALYRVPVTGGEPFRLYGNGEAIHRGYQISISPDGTRLLYNSELWRDDPIRHLDEELFEVDLLTGITRQLSFEPGHQYGWHAIGGEGEFVQQSSPAAGANYDLFLAVGYRRIPLDIDDPGNLFDDHSPTWWKRAP